MATVLPSLERHVGDQERGFMRELLFGSCRYYHRLNAIAKMLLSNPFHEDAEELHCLLIVGLYQLDIQGKAQHAAVHATVDACDGLGHSGAKSVLNACLRRYLREKDTLLTPLADNPVTATSHPKWLVKWLQKAWPEHKAAILDANNQQAPLCLRINRRQIDRDDYVSQLSEHRIEAHSGPSGAHAVYLHQSTDVTQLPGFDAGHFSVQDEAAQLAAQILSPNDGERVLDACAAPGGKTCHLLELADIQLTAVELEANRIPRIHDNLTRLKLSATVIQADASQPDDWWDQQCFDAILLDAPCSATGVIRRHPDIKMLRRRDDIAPLVTLQAAILEQNWAMLAPGGRLLYATCSVLPEENSLQIAQFLARHPDAHLQTLDIPGAIGDIGAQLLPTPNAHDGFYYALMHKSSDNTAGSASASTHITDQGSASS